MKNTSNKPIPKKEIKKKKPKQDVRINLMELDTSEKLNSIFKGTKIKQKTLQR